MKCSLSISNFLQEISRLSHLLFSSISLHWSLRKAFLSLLLFFGTLHSDGNIFPFLLCFPLLFFSQLFVRPPQTAILLFCISFPWGWSWSLSPVQCHEPPQTSAPQILTCPLIPEILYKRRFWFSRWGSAFLMSPLVRPNLFICAPSSRSGWM